MTETFIPLGDVLVDPAWNARSYADVVSEQSLELDPNRSTAEGSGLTGLMADIAASGQRDAVVVRPVPREGFYRKTDKPYALVSGFRRFEAISRLRQDGKTSGQIRARVIPMTEAEARIENVKENTFRNELDVPDLVWAVKQLSVLGLTQQEIGLRIGKTQSHVSILMSVGDLPSAILTHWRSGGDFVDPETGQRRNFGCKRASLDNMRELARTAPEKQVAEYQRMLDSRPEKRLAPKETQRRSARRTAERVGRMLGVLAREGALTVHPEGGWEGYLRWVCPPFESAAERRRAAEALQEAYEGAMQR